jgi:hypothetical protein
MYTSLYMYCPLKFVKALNTKMVIPNSKFCTREGKKNLCSGIEFSVMEWLKSLELI